MDRIRKLNKLIDRKVERYERLYNGLSGKGIDYSGERVQTSLPEGSPMENTMVMIKDLEEELNVDIARLVLWRHLMTRLIITNVEDKEARDMALAFYVDNQSYKWIAEFFGLIGEDGDAEKGIERVRYKCKKAKNCCVYHLDAITW